MTSFERCLPTAVKPSCSNSAPSSSGIRACIFYKFKTVGADRVFKKVSHVTSSEPGRCSASNESQIGTGFRRKIGRISNICYYSNSITVIGNLGIDLRSCYKGYFRTPLRLAQMISALLTTLSATMGMKRSWITALHSLIRQSSINVPLSSTLFSVSL